MIKALAIQPGLLPKGGLMKQTIDSGNLELTSRTDNISHIKKEHNKFWLFLCSWFITAVERSEYTKGTN